MEEAVFPVWKQCRNRLFVSQDWIQTRLCEQLSRGSTVGFHLLLRWNFPIQTAACICHYLHSRVLKQSDWTEPTEFYDKPFSVYGPCGDFLGFSTHQMAEEPFKQWLCVHTHGQVTHKVVWGVLFTTGGGIDRHRRAELKMLLTLQRLSSFEKHLFFLFYWCYAAFDLNGVLLVKCRVEG